MDIYRDDRFYLKGVDELQTARSEKALTFRTTHGDFHAVFRSENGIKTGAMFLTDSTVDTDGPGGVFGNLAHELHRCGIASLRMGFRIPNNYRQCTVDALLALQYLDDDDIHEVIAVGWQGGGTVALIAGSLARTIKGVSAIAASTPGDYAREMLRKKPVMLIYGEEDKHNYPRAARRICGPAETSCKTIIYPETGASLESAYGRLYEDLRDWSLGTLAANCAGAVV